MGLAAAAAGLALSFVYAPAGVAIATVAVLVAFPKIFELNVPANRLIAMSGIACYGAALGLASGSWLLAAAGTAPLFLSLPHELVVVTVGYRWSRAMFVGMALGVGLTLLSWPPNGWWAAALAPVLFLATFTPVIIRDGQRWSRQNRAAWGVRVGKPVEDFRLASRQGEEDFVLSDQRGKWVLLQFARADWCPVCHVMTRVLKRVADDAGDKNVRIVLVSPQDAELDDVTTEDLGLTYTVVADPDHAIAKRFGVIDTEAYGGKGAPVPAIFLIDPEGVLRKASSSSDVAALPDPDSFVRVLAQAG
jgi:peroxiredoxin Q/BCP